VLSYSDHPSLLARCTSLHRTVLVLVLTSLPWPCALSFAVVAQTLGLRLTLRRPSLLRLGKSRTYLHCPTCQVQLKQIQLQKNRKKILLPKQQPSRLSIRNPVPHLTRGIKRLTIQPVFMVSQQTPIWFPMAGHPWGLGMLWLQR